MRLTIHCPHFLLFLHTLVTDTIMKISNVNVPPATPPITIHEVDFCNLLSNNNKTIKKVTILISIN